MIKLNNKQGVKMSDNNTKYPIDDKNYRYQIALKSMNVGTWEWNIQTDELILMTAMQKCQGIKKKNFYLQQSTYGENLFMRMIKKALDEIDNHFQNHTEYYDIEF